MAEYTYEDIIMDPDDPRLEGAIGKECYFSDYPKKLLSSAIYNSPEYLDCLTDIRKEGACTFVDKNGSGWTLIIIKKEEPKPKYVPFESKEEFVRRYTEVKEGADFDTFEDNLFQCGMWLKDKETDSFFMVTEIWDDGVIVTDRKMKTTKVRDDEYFTINESTTWKELLRDYCFIDGSPCGKEMEDV